MCVRGVVRGEEWSDWVDPCGWCARQQRSANDGSKPRRTEGCRVQCN